MTKTVIQFIVLFLVLVVLQLVCNKIVLFNVAMPVVFIYLILRLPVNLHGGRAALIHQLHADILPDPVYHFSKCHLISFLLNL